ncbi:deoxynucleoside kinase [Flavobacteriales bacterium]|jgi:deoxyadenosine/deoxycytidine kinase|nr:deoxynucleoside kinase [Flavobacteriales bacterium]
MHIAIAGNIGSGKTTLTEKLSKHYGYEAMFEQADNNPYINDFYDDMQRWSFNMQIYYLQSRYNLIQNLRESGKNVIQDRTIFEDAEIFAPNLHSMGLMTSRDFDNYIELYSLINKLVPSPDLLIYLRASVSTLVSQIQARGRDYEASIRLDYLTRLNERYEAFVSSYEGNVLIIDIDNNNFPESQEDLGKIIQSIDGQINGLF